MQFRTSYPTVSLDSIANAATFFSGHWSPDLKRNQSQQVLIHLTNRLYGASHGALFHARIRASHADLADRLGLSRPWTCKLIGRLRDTGWIETEAPRLPGSQQQDITVFRIGRMFKKLLVMLRKSKQRSRVTDQAQVIPKSEDWALDMGKKTALKIREREEEPPSPAVLKKLPLLKTWLGRGMKT